MKDNLIEESEEFYLSRKLTIEGAKKYIDNKNKKHYEHYTKITKSV